MSQHIPAGEVLGLQDLGNVYLFGPGEYVWKRDPGGAELRGQNIKFERREFIDIGPLFCDKGVILCQRL